jgi:hypothetical protein
MTLREVARRLNVDRSAISRAVQRAANDADLITAAGTIPYIDFPPPYLGHKECHYKMDSRKIV